MARRGGGGFTARPLEKASKIVPPIAVDGFIFHASVSQYHRYVGTRGNEVEWSHDGWGNTPSSMPSLPTVVGSPYDADDPIDIVHHRILSLDATSNVDGRYRCLAPTQLNLSGGARCPRLPAI